MKNPTEWWRPEWRWPKWSWDRWRWPLAILASVFALVFLCGRYFPWIQAQVWYLCHLNGVPFLGKVIPVPRGMIGSVEKRFESNDAFFVQSSPAFHKHSGNFAWWMSFSPDKLPHRTEQGAVKQLGENLRIGWSRAGGVVGPAFAIDTLEGKGWCYRTTFPPKDGVITSCVLFNAEWEAMYTGPAEYEKDFLKVIAGIHRAKKK